MTHRRKAETKPLDKAKSHTVYTLKKSRQKREKLRTSGEAYSVAAAETSSGEDEMGGEAEVGRRRRAAD
jgi:hypothetical protein